MPLSSGKILTSGDSGKCFRWRLTRPGAGGWSGGCSSSARFELELDALDRLAIGRVGLRRIVDDEGVQRVAVPRRVHPGVEDRQSLAPEEAADPREELLAGRARRPSPAARPRRARGARARPARCASGTVVQVARVPGDLVGRVALEVDAVEVAPERAARLPPAPRRGAAAGAPPAAAPAGCRRASPRPSSRRARARVALNRSSSSCAFHAFHTLGLVPRMSATVSM